MFLDESGVNTDVTRRYACARIDDRVVDSTPINTSCNTTILSSIWLGGKTTHTIY